MTALIHRTRHVQLVLVVNILAVLALCAPAFAQDPDVADRTFVLPPTWVMLLAGFTTSTLTAYFTKMTARPWVKAILNMVLVAVATVIEYIVTHNGTFTLDQVLDIFVMTFLINLGVWLGVFRPGVIPHDAQLPESGIA